ncbi:MAG TPA: Calx-beta domain-containing protein [Pyrinomonadaceae bacterium]
MSNFPCGANLRRSNWRRFAARVTAVTAFAILIFFVPNEPARAQSNGSPNLVISQVYTRGGAAGASYNRDFVEIFNRGTEPVDFNNYGLHVTLDSSPVPGSLFVRIASSRSIVIQPGRYLLIAFKGDGVGGQALPTPDFDLGITLPGPFPVSSNLHPTSGAVVLVAPDGSYTTCTTAGQTGVVDMVGYGPQSPCREAQAAPSPTLTESLQRFGGGCTDTNNNSSDFQPSPVLPRNSGWAAGQCSGSTPLSFFNFGVSQFDTHEAAGHAEIVVTRTGDLSTPATVEYSISGGSAFERADYTTAAGRLRFAPGESQKSFDILLTDDATQEQNETIELLIWKPTGTGAVMGIRDHATLVIHDNDLGPAASNPVDASAFFVRQHYHDFLNREPDTDGLNFWIDNIEKCNDDQQCREVKRIDTSAAFFFSIEFQRTGFLVYRLYKAALPEKDYRLRSLPRYLEFVRDTQEVGRNVVVGQAGWEAQLDANTALLLEDFMSRPEFAVNYPESLPPNEYVDKLNAQAGSPLTQQERDQLVAGLFIGSETRATVLRKVAENAEFTRRQTLPAFVYMQYVGYLRRAPNDPPDTDFSGLDFWLAKLNDFGGDYRGAEMVKAFVTSIEYRARFMTPAP